MKYLILFLLLTATLSCHADVTLQPGENEFHTELPNKKKIIVRAEVSAPRVEHCESWRWGSEAECPKLAIVGLQVLISEEILFIPRSAFADLGSPSRLSIEKLRSGFDIIVHGGDAATAYTARLRFSLLQIKRRRVESGEFRDSAWEDTRFSFTR